MKIKDIMVKKVESIPLELSVKEAMNILFRLQISGLPVVDKEGKLAGMFTEKNILVYLLPSYVQQVGKFVYEENPKATKRKLLELGKIKVGELMRKEVVATTEDVTLCEVARIMLAQKIRRLPVIDKDRRLVGIIARVDVLKALTKEAEGSE